ncbi:uncharacterized protein ATC70_011299 [Mucor velutinosus]|uniref:ORC6 second cyclin-like domain-containing protein n=1 Tax=Mucor velutinosus TaxID=708070 RepID=A0AAN7DGR4_9FUNG|nr:hypothetical protein ATC70_011299 [Mucor velutinosus]
MSNPISHCLARLNLEDDIKVKQRTEEFHGQLSSVPAKFFDSGPNLKIVVCIQLAYESLGNLDWDVGLGSRLAGCSTPAYEKALSLCRKRLDIRPTVTFDALTIALGSSTMLTPVQELWDNFVQEYPKKFTGVDRRNAIQDLEMAAWKGAAVFCCAKAHGDALSKDRLHTLCFCTKPELSQCIKTVERTCLTKLNELKVRSRKSLRNTQTRTPKKEAKEKKAETSTPQPMDIDHTSNEANNQQEAAPSPIVESRSSRKAVDDQKKAASIQQKSPIDQRKIPSVQQKSPSIQQKEASTQQKLPTVKASKPKPKRKESEMDASVDNVSKKKTRTVSGIVSMINEQDYTTSKKFLEFCQWKSTMIDQLQRAS